MKRSNPHIIKKISAELVLPSANEQEEQSAQLKAAIYEALKNTTYLLDQTFGPATYRLDYLSVELNVEIGQLSNLSDRLREEIRQEILKIGASLDFEENTSNFQEIKQSLEAEKFLFKGSGLFNQSEKQSIEKIDPDQRRRELLLHFLQSGRLPWWADRDTAFSIMEQELNSLSGEEFSRLIQPHIENDRFVALRIVEQFSEEVVRQLIEKVSKSSAQTAELFAVVDDFKTFFAAQELAYGPKQRILTELREKILISLMLGQPMKAAKKGLFKSILNEILSIETSKSPETLLQASDVHHKEAILQLLEKNTIEINKRAEINDEPPFIKKQKWVKGIEEESLSVANAGIVLLHPFIQRFFGNLGLLEEDAFTGEAARERAVCLLHHLAAGDDGFREPELVLPKFLCGWPLEQPVNRFLPISDYEKEEAGSVLRSAIEYWEALKNTSADALRSTFLQREGLLGEEEFGWSVHIEEQTQDILLGKLPWEISVVKFPWMDEMLTVNWT